MARVDTPEKPVREKRCENCACYDGFEKQCRANYPTPVPIGGPGGQLGAAGIFPPMKPDDWCRKHEAVLS